MTIRDGPLAQCAQLSARHGEFGGNLILGFGGVVFSLWRCEVLRRESRRACGRAPLGPSSTGTSSSHHGGIAETSGLLGFDGGGELVFRYNDGLSASFFAPF